MLWDFAFFGLSRGSVHLHVCSNISVLLPCVQPWMPHLMYVSCVCLGGMWAGEGCCSRAAGEEAARAASAKRTLLHRQDEPADFTTPTAGHCGVTGTALFCSESQSRCHYIVIQSFLRNNSTVYGILFGWKMYKTNILQYKTNILDFGKNPTKLRFWTYFICFIYELLVLLP